jgi:high-affinity K+ transport system ATPase subunit B
VELHLTGVPILPKQLEEEAPEVWKWISKMLGKQSDTYEALLDDCDLRRPGYLAVALSLKTTFANAAEAKALGQAVQRAASFRATAAATTAAAARDGVQNAVAGGGSYCRQNGELSMEAQAACLLEMAEGEDEAAAEAVVRADMKPSWFLR